MFGSKDNLHLEIDPSLDEVFDEGSGSTFLALRKLRWSETSEFKVDIRKWYVNRDGEEVAGKGVSFLTEDGPTNLAVAMAKHGLIDPVLMTDNMAKTDPEMLVEATAHAMVYNGIPIKKLQAKYDEIAKMKDEEDSEYVNLAEAIL